jgi:hypothetical protein
MLHCVTLQVFLDAIGEPLHSPRRQGTRGIYERHLLNQGDPKTEFDLILLDERYERVPLPCYTRRDFCLPDIAKSESRKVLFISGEGCPETCASTRCGGGLL